LAYAKKTLACQAQNDFYSPISAGSTIFIDNISFCMISAITKQHISSFILKRGQFPDPNYQWIFRQKICKK